MLNKVQLIGNLGRDADLKYTGDNMPYLRFSLATTRVWTDKTTKQKKEATEWHRVVVWGKFAETIAPYLVKGKQVYVEGWLQTREWEKDGAKQYTTEVRSTNMILLGGPKNGPPAPAVAVGDDDDIPFAWLVPFIMPALMSAPFWLRMAA